MRVLVLAVALAPFLVWAGLDAAYHLRSRKPGVLENLTHVALGGSQVLTIFGAFGGDVPRLAIGAALVALFGSLDELVFHRALPARESDLHAKSHIGLFTFVAIAVALAIFPDVASVLRALRREAAP